MLEAWLQQITEALDRHNQANPDLPAAPFAVNQIVHRSNVRLDRDLEIFARWKVPVWITSLGADLGYVGSAFIATTEANAQPEYKQMLVDSSAEDIVTSSLFTGVSGNYLAPSISRAGMDPGAC